MYTFFILRREITWANYNDVSRRVVTLNGGLGIIVICRDTLYFEKGNYYALKGSRYVLRKGLALHSYSKDGIKTINPTLGKGLDS